MRLSKMASGVAVLLLVYTLAAGCSMPSTPGEAIGEKGLSRTPDGLYLASLVVLDVNTDYGIPLLVGPNISSFPVGEVEFWVVNKWGGLQEGAYAEAVRILAQDGRTVLGEEVTEFDWTSEHFTVSTAKFFALPDAEPGVYYVSVVLNGAEVQRYGVRVLPAD